MDELLNLLMVEDSEGDAELILRQLDRAGRKIHSTRVDSARQMSRELAEGEWDVVLSDHRMAGFDAVAALETLQQSGKDIPFIIVSGSIGEELAVELMKSGAHDYVSKNNLSRLLPVVEREIREARDRQAHAVDAAALREAQQRLRQVVESSPVVLFTLSIDAGRIGGISWFSDNLRTVFGYSAEKPLCSEWWFSRVHPDDLKQALDAAHSELFLKGSTETEYRFLKADGTYCWTRAAIRLIRGQDGLPTEAAGAWCDISERKQAEDEQTNLREQLQQAQKLESVGRLAGGVAHDFNNLLTVINGYTALALKKLAPTDPLYESLEEVRIAGERATSLSQQLLTLSRKTVLQPANISLNDIAREVEKMLQRVIGEDIRLETALAGDLPYVLADAGSMHQVLMNLAVNARDAMPNGGSLRIQTSRACFAPGEAEPLGLTAGAYACLNVIDTGVGISRDVMPHLFEPFFTTKRQGQGTGLGLATVYSIVKQCGGCVKVKSELGRGTTFTIYLPESHESSYKETANVANGDATGSAAILLVEDEEQVRKMAARVLRDAGYRVVEATHSAEAIELAERTDTGIDLLLTDVIMPDLSGPELAKLLRPRRPAMKVLFTSGFSDHSGAEDWGADFSNSYLAKPFTPEALRAKVFEALARRPSGETVLVVDDEAAVRQTLCEFLSEAGYRVLQANDGADALEKLKTCPADLMITDLSMPEQEGLETIRRLHRERPKLKMIAMSGVFAPSMLRAAELFGAGRSLAKPIKKEELLEAVSCVIHGE